MLPMGDMYVLKNSGPRTDPWGTPSLMNTLKEL